MAKREKKTKPATKPRAAKKPAAKRKTAKPSPKKRTPRAHRSKILAEAKSKGWTADQIAKKAGVSKWTVYGWNKRSATKGKRTAVKRGRPVGSRTSRGSLGEMLRPLIAQMVREELARLAGTR